MSVSKGTLWEKLLSLTYDRDDKTVENEAVTVNKCTAS